MYRYNLLTPRTNSCPAYMDRHKITKIHCAVMSAANRSSYDNSPTMRKSCLFFQTKSTARDDTVGRTTTDSRLISQNNYNIFRHSLREETTTFQRADNKRVIENVKPKQKARNAIVTYS